jgi:hypothetical protein
MGWVGQQPLQQPTNQQTNNASRLQFYKKERILHGWNSSLAAVVQNR